MTESRWTSMRPRSRSSDIRLEVVGRESLTQAVRAVATVVPDESRISHVHTRVAGWVEQLDVNTTGEMVTAGQPLARIFSQELLSSQTEYLAARRNTAASGIASAVIASGRTRLTVLGMTPAEIDAIEQTGEPKRLVTVVAPQERRRREPRGHGRHVGRSVDDAADDCGPVARLGARRGAGGEHSGHSRRHDRAARLPGVRPSAVRGTRRFRLSDAHRPHAHAAGPLLGGQSRRRAQAGPVRHRGL